MINADKFLGSPTIEIVNIDTGEMIELARPTAMYFLGHNKGNFELRVVKPTNYMERVA